MRKTNKFVPTKRVWIIAIAAVLAVAVIAMICSSLTGEGIPFLGNRKSYEIIHSEYVDWSVPADCMEFLKYESEVNNNVVADMFNLKSGDTEIPVFRFDFGDENAGDWLGLITVGEEKIPVVYTVFMVSDEELASLGDAGEAYYKLMDVFNEMVKDLNENKNFSPDKPIMISGSEQTAQLTYWTVTLPAEMSWQEANENGVYQVVFYGDIGGELIALYQVRIGGEAAEGQLGLYNIDGEDKIISVISHDVLDRPGWSEDDNAVAYHMMDTINLVIDQILSSESYSEPSQE